MRRLWVRVLIPFTLGALAVAQSLTPSEREKGINYLEQTRNDVIAATKGLSDAQMKFKPAPDRWSIAETLEHITLAEDYLFSNVTQNIMRAQAGPAGRDTAKVDALILSAVPDRSQKRHAPGPLVPSGRWTTAEMLAHFEQSRAKTISFLKSTLICASMLRRTIPFSSLWMHTNGCCLSRRTASVTQSRSLK